MEPKYWWTILGIAGFIIEIFTPGFFAASIGIGAFCAAVTALFTPELEYQLWAAALGTILSFIAIRPLWKKYLFGKKDVKTNADAMLGQHGVVSETIDAAKNTGRVAIDGDDWKAVSVNDEIIAEGERVQVAKRESIILTVTKIQ